MRSFKFPIMFQTNSSNIWKTNEYFEATKQNTLLLLQTERGEMFGDPYLGVLLQKYLFDQNNFILRESLIDTIYTQIALFLPQIKIKREDIDVYKGNEKGKLYCKIKGINQIDYTLNTYNLLLFKEAEEV